MNKMPYPLIAVVLLLFPCQGRGSDLQQENPVGPYLGNGIKIGEVDQTSARVWVRLTKNKSAFFSKLPILTEGLLGNKKSDLPMPLGVVPGANGQVRVTYWVAGDPGTKGMTKWKTVSRERDFTLQLKLNRLQPNAGYRCLVEARGPRATTVSHQLSGKFKTAPAALTAEPIRFIVSTCQAVRSIDSGADGHVAYQQMLKFDPHFFVHTGDILYYDKVPLCKNVAQARAKWNLMFCYGHNRRFHQNVASYFMKDDHDTLKNDCWPGQKYGELTFGQGLEIFREQVCMGEKTYRTVRWGKDVQIWMTENRDFRSSNRMKDGPGKTILGKTQKAWLKKTILDSDATFKFVITPGPIVGPDKKGKADNHSNKNFAFEGQELRDFLSAQENVYVVCGDRHWQYCSRDPGTGLIELGCGPINDEHSFGGNPGHKPEYHRYFSGKGGFLGISVDGATAKAEWFTSNEIDSQTNRPRVRHRETLPLEVQR